MFARDLHLLLASLTLLAVLAATADGAVRTVTGRPPAITAQRTRTLALTGTAVTSAAGLALLLTGHRPNEWLHLLYAVLALGLIPVADNLVQDRGTNRTKALTRLIAGLTTLVILIRLLATG